MDRESMITGLIRIILIEIQAATLTWIWSQGDKATNVTPTITLERADTKRHAFSNKEMSVENVLKHIFLCNECVNR